MDNIKVLVVDDNSRIVNLLKDAITKETDMDVIATAADGEEALKKIEIHNPDVVLLDLIMPRLDGLGVMERLKEKKKITSVPKIIVISAVSQESVTENAFALGAAAVAGGKKAYNWFKNRKHKPEVVEGDAHCVSDDISDSDEESVKG